MNSKTGGLNFETCLKKMEPRINRLASIVARNSKCYEFDDAKQILSIDTWRSFQKYDPSRGTVFTTYCFNQLNLGFRNLIRNSVSFGRRFVSVDHTLQDIKTTESAFFVSRDKDLLIESEKARNKLRVIEIVKGVLDSKCVLRPSSKNLRKYIKARRVWDFVCRGWSMTKIANKMSVSYQYVYHLYTTKILPIVQAAKTTVENC